jgi:hypothetical protein
MTDDKQLGGRPQGPPEPKPAPAPELSADTPPDPKQLTPEEQMALFEKDLRENDWGHQPC